MKYGAQEMHCIIIPQCFMVFQNYKKYVILQ